MPCKVWLLTLKVFHTQEFGHDISSEFFVTQSEEFFLYPCSNLDQFGRDTISEI